MLTMAKLYNLSFLVLWTITDFSGLGYASRFVTTGEACPDCHSYTCSIQLGSGSKTCYMGHRRFLHENHPFRFDADKFGDTEFRPAPIPLSGEEILDCTKGLNTVFGNHLERNQQARNARKGMQ